MVSVTTLPCKILVMTLFMFTKDRFCICYVLMVTNIYKHMVKVEPYVMCTLESNHYNTACCVLTVPVLILGDIQMTTLYV